MKTILLTGATDGIGLEAARTLISKGHRVLMHGRNAAKLQSAAQDVGLANADQTTTFLADLSDLSQVYQLAKDVKTRNEHIDVVINNAGVFQVPASASTVTKDGLDIRMAVNMVAPYILTKELLPILKPHGRIVNISSAGQATVDSTKAFPTEKTTERLYGNDYEAYSQSKLGLIMWTTVLAGQFTDHMLVSVNPASLIGTKMVREGFGEHMVRNEVSKGANILVEAAIGDSFDKTVSGKYFDNDSGRFAPPHAGATDMARNQQFVASMENWLTEHGFQ